MDAYFRLGLTLVLSLVGSTMLKMSEAFTHPVPTIIFAVTYSLAFLFFAQALRTIPLSLGYAIWSGFSTAGNALVGHFYFGEDLRPIKILVLFIIIIGIILINNAKILDTPDYQDRSTLVIR